MPHAPAPSTHTHEIGTTRFTSLATPSTGSAETSVWRVDMLPGTQPNPHHLTREEIFVILSGVARATFDGVEQLARPGDALVVPPGVEFSLAVEGDDPLSALCCLPAGGQAQLPGQDPFTPPWAL